MALVPAAPFDIRDYRMDFQTVPSVVTPGEKATLRFGIFHPGTGQRITRFETVHEQRYHLFVISQDMEYFQHIHPEQQRDGTWSVDVMLPKPGYYKGPVGLFSGSRVRAVHRAAAGHRRLRRRPRASSASLVRDTVPTKVVDDVTATVSYSPTTFVAGQWGHLTFHLTDTASGRPITDLQTYLGAMGHTLIMSRGHGALCALPPDQLTPGVGRRRAAGVSDPAGHRSGNAAGRPGRVVRRTDPDAGTLPCWAQFRRHDRVYTFPFTFEATAAE